MLWRLSPEHVDPRSSRLGMSPEYLSQPPPVQPVTLAFPAPPPTHTLGVA